MVKLQVYHNARCGKSRECIAYLEQKGLSYNIIEYTKDTLSEESLLSLLDKLKLKASELVRKNEEIYKTNFKGRKMSKKQWVKAMIKYPSLMQRPIVVYEEKAVVARPPEEIDKLF